MNDNTQKVKKQIKTGRKVKPWVEYEKELREVHGDRYEYRVDTYINAKTKITIICPQHGEFQQIPASHRHGKGCRKCAISNNPQNTKKPWYLLEKEFIKVHVDKYKYVSISYVGQMKKMIIVCPTHGQFKQSPTCHKRGQGCPECGNTNKSWEDVLKTFRSVHQYRYEYKPETYKLSKTPMIIVCPVHGDFEQTPEVHSWGHGCHKCNCASGVSKGETEIFDFIQSLGVKATQSNRILDDKKEIDILILSKMLGIEYCGEYYHSEKKNKASNYHRDKFIEAKERNIQLITIFENEWSQKKEVVKSMIRHKLGKSEKAVNARACEIIELTNEQRKKYLNQWHLQGAPIQKDYTVGLSKNGLIYCVMSFNKARFGNGQYELTRFACLPSTNIRGGFSKLLKYWVRKNQGVDLISYVDHRVGTGASYLTAGFEKVHDVKPSYFWNKNKTNLDKRKARHSKLGALLGDKYNPNQTEKENMERAGWSRVWDCGKTKFRLST